MLGNFHSHGLSKCIQSLGNFSFIVWCLALSIACINKLSELSKKNSALLWMLLKVKSRHRPMLYISTPSINCFFVYDSCDSKPEQTPSQISVVCDDIVKFSHLKSL